MTDRLVIPKVLNYQLTGTYLASKQLSRQTVSHKLDWDQPPNNPKVNDIITRRLRSEAELKLNEARELAASERANLDAQWRDLEDKELALKQNFIKFHSFVKENKEKRDRAQTQINEDMKVREKREEQINELHENYQHKTEMKIVLDAHVRKYQIYENYLQRVIKDHPDECSNINEIINRYETLIEAKTYLAAKQEIDLNALESARSRMAKLIETNGFIIVGLNNRVTQLQLRYQNVARDVLYWENIVESIQSNTIRLRCEIDAIKRCTWNIYVAMCKHKGIDEMDVFRQEDFERQIIFIKKTLVEVARITKAVEDAKRRKHSRVSSIEGHVSAVNS